MKVLFVCNNIYRKKENPFIRVLIQSLQQNGVEAEYGLDNFWNNYQKYDVIHFQWPEKIFGGGHPIDLEKIERHLNALKEAGIKTVITCHNFHPHKFNADLCCLYDLLYAKCDAVHHLGEYSCQQLKHKTGHLTNHFIVGHPAYYSIDEVNITKEEARERLQIAATTKVVLCFGDFRFSRERALVLKAFNQLPYDDKLLLAPRFFHNKIPLSFFWYRLVQLLNRKKYGKSSFSKGFISDSDLPCYLTAADVLLIQRKEILNSGNLFLGFSFGKAVVGPDRGNVGFILRQTGNPVFDPDNPSTLITALQKGFDLQSSLSARNLEYASRHLDKTQIAGEMVQEYQRIIQESPSVGCIPSASA
jgi:glycosyltransferase involved in cell wall biosynthesis